MCVLVRRGIAFVEHELNVASDIDGTLIEIIPSKGKTAGLYLLNVYSTPSKKGLTHTFEGLFREAMAKASSKPLLICGDFNAPHTHWGCGSDSPKGSRLAELVDDLGLTLLNEPASHTRIGQAGGEGADAPDPTRVDSRLEHLVLAKKSMQRRVSKQRLYKKLRKKITDINREIETHSSRLCEQEWEELCNTMDGNMSAGRTWKILEHLLEPARTRTAVRTEMAKLRHKYADDLEVLADEVVRTHLTRPGSLDHPEEVEGHLEGTGLVCAPNKSEILLHRPRKPGRLPKDVAAARQTGVQATTKEGGRIPTVSKIRVLGLWLEENGANSELVTRLRRKLTIMLLLLIGDDDTRKRSHQDNGSGGQRFDEDFLANVVRARKPDVQDNEREDKSAVLKEEGHDKKILLIGAPSTNRVVNRAVVAKLLFMTPDLFLPEVSEPVLYYGSSGVALLLQWAAALIRKNGNLQAALEQQQRCLRKAASSALRRKVGDKEGKLVLTTSWALKVAHWAAVAEPDAGQPASAEVVQEDKELAETRSRLFFLRFCATTCGNRRSAKSCKIGVHLSKEFSEAFGCRAPPDYLC
ncbi:hypothetical protein MTO96_020661 [Rhipicephalus appendiculatus]